jgi:hypothetical protein
VLLDISDTESDDDCMLQDQLSYVMEKNVEEGDSGSLVFLNYEDGEQLILVGVHHSATNGKNCGVASLVTPFLTQNWSRKVSWCAIYHDSD